MELDKGIHDRASFDCGETELNLFIQTQASKHMQAGISRTMVLPASNPFPNQKIPICAFYSITPGSICRDTLPEALVKKLPRYPVPVFLIAQLAVHREFQGEGLGKICLVNALKYLWEINAHMRAYAIIVDCLTDAAETFYAKYGFAVLCEHNGKVRMFLPMKTVARLFSS
ncbi:GNAT family N-acetyltransferase [Endozoicomonas acroporae]|uniref:GNAT family N-acetyltransferase n=1 Tax=Endozoicomonas acroporae TaxID=1701104 RepID=UPI001F50CB48|nr:GNAT family N-acetyltransferase [Endozoicomonas acroporae]